MAKIIGLTGGIGSGKTTVANYFRDLGIPIYISDEAAKKITQQPEVILAIAHAFGENIVDSGKINREKLAQIVFNDADALQKLNNIIHPAVKQDFIAWMKNHENNPIVIKEAAILFESGNHLTCDAVITVIAPFELRMDRVVKRDQTTRENVIRRMENQWTDEMRISKSDYVIDNVDVIHTKQQVREILKKLQNF